MKKVLFINSTPKKMKDSYTLRMTYEIMEAYKKSNPNDEIITLNLYDEDMKFLDLKFINNGFESENERLEAQKYAHQFVEADKYIIAAPMWHFSVPAILKAYFDRVNIAGITYDYTVEGAVGLLKEMDKKAVFVSSRGTVYSTGPLESFEMGERYVRTLLGFMGIEDIETMIFESGESLKGQALIESFNKKLDQSRKIGEAL